MSWSPIVPRAPMKTGSRRDAPVSVGRLMKSQRQSAGLLVILRPYLLPSVPAFLAAGSGVVAMIGGGQHAGMIRLQPGQVFKLGKTAANAPGKPVLQLRLPLPAGMDEGAAKAVPVEFDYSDDWLELTLPAWAAVKPAAAATTPDRGKELAAAAAAEARRRAGL
jgi:hypothetical protein